MARKSTSDLPTRWAWAERDVDPADDHFALRYGSAGESDWDTWVLVARVGRPVQEVFGVQFLVARDVAALDPAVKAVTAELDFYLVEKGEQNPWAYAQYHCGTSANLYSKVHWLYSRRAERSS